MSIDIPALRADLSDVTVTVAALPDLVALKRDAARPRDLEDVAELEALQRAFGDDDGH